MESIDHKGLEKQWKTAGLISFFSSKIIHFVSDFISMENMEDGEEY